MHYLQQRPQDSHAELQLRGLVDVDGGAPAAPGRLSTREIVDGIATGGPAAGAVLPTSHRPRPAIGQTLHEDLRAGVHGPFRRDRDNRGAASVGDDAAYDVGWTVTPNQPIAGARTVRIDVSWRESAGRRAFSLTVFR